MLTVPHHTTKQILKKQKKTSSHFNSKPFSYSSPAKEYSRLRFIKRLSPFLFSAMLIPIIAIYALATEIHIINNTWLQLFAFAGIEVYLLFFDFVLWNYFEGKKLLRIWCIEISALLAIIIFAAYF